MEKQHSTQSGVAEDLPNAVQRRAADPDGLDDKVVRGHARLWIVAKRSGSQGG